MADRREDAAQDALFREVDEDLRHEQMARVWKKYGGIVVAAALAIVIAVAGYQGWQAWERSTREDAAARFQAAMQALSAGQQETALDQFSQLAEDAGTGYGPVAALRRATLLAEQGDTAGAIAAFRAVAANGSADPAFRNLATVLAVLHALEGGAESADALIAELQPLTDPANAFRFSALELTALLTLRQGDEARARELYTQLAGEAGAPSGVRTRAQQMVAALGGEPPAAADTPASDPASTGQEG